MAFEATDQALSFAAPKYNLDKVIYRPPTTQFSVTQSVSPVVPDAYTTTINNPLERLFFIDMQLSTDANTWYDLGFEPTYYDAGFGRSFKRFFAAWHMDVATITYTFYALDAAYDLYYRVIGLSKD